MLHHIRRRVLTYLKIQPMMARSAASAYLGRMFKSFDFCLPATAVPATPDWPHGELPKRATKKGVEFSAVPHRRRNTFPAAS
jgi:hypothetical protein